MIDPVSMDVEPKPRPKRISASRYGRWFAQALIVLALFNGLADIAYFSAVEILGKSKTLAGSVASRPAGWADLRLRIVPGLGNVVEAASGPGLHVDSLGIRSTETAPRNEVHGVLLGSSQAFGWHIANDETVAAAIERGRTDTNVTVIAGPGRTAAESMVHWQQVLGRVDAPDFGILLFSNFELYEACQPAPQPRNNELALVGFARKLLRRLFPTIKEEPPCATPEARTAIAERSLYELKAALEFGRRQTPHFAVIIAPLLYGNDSNAQLIRGPLAPEFAESLDRAVREFRARVSIEKIPDVIDLSDAFDGNGDQYFIDTASHFSPAGANRLAAKILESLPESFFTDIR